MGWFKVVLMRRKLIVGLAVLTVAVAMPILCINLLGSGTMQQDDEITKEQEFGEFGVGLFCPTDDDIRDPQIALQHGILGYVELSWVDDPPIAMHQGEVWSGTCLAHFVSHTCEVTEAELHIEPGEGALRGGRYYTREDGTEVFLDYSRFLCYWPQGVFKIKADETMVIEVTLRVPSDLPRSIQDFRLYPYDIWVGEHQGKMPGVSLLFPDHPREVQIIHDPLPSDDP
jgi:hypothetical protein